MLALRIPFLHQAIQGDDVNYLYGAEHAQIDPLHPSRTQYAFQGRMVDMRGHPHPPLNAWVLAGLLAILGDVREAPFHAAYIAFSAVAAVSALALARRFSPRPLAATLLFLATPAFVINGNSLEADLPLVAFWLASIALYVRAVDRRSVAWLVASGGAMLLAAMAAYQSIALVPILLFYGRRWKPAWAAALVAPVTIGAWQLFERATSGVIPASLLAGYMQSYGLQTLIPKLRSAAALTAHLGWILFPTIPAWAFFRIGWMSRIVWVVLTAAAVCIDAHPLFWASASIGLLTILWSAGNRRDFLAAWVLIFFAAALIIFFAGSARYLLPLVLPVAILASRQVPARWLYAGLCAQFALSLGLAIVNYQHWDGYRQFARALAPQVESKRVWINGEWGLRFYFEAGGALPLLQNQTVHPGEMVVTSSLAQPVAFTTGGGQAVPIEERAITSRIPLRLVALNRPAGYSTTQWGLRPFDISTAVIDRVSAALITEARPEQEYLTMNSPASARQIVSGIYEIENGQWRWMSATGVLLLKSPEHAKALTVSLFIPAQAPARRIGILLDGQTMASQTYSAPGAYTLVAAPVKPAGPTATLTITADKLFRGGGDLRELAVILTAAGFK